MANGAKTSVQRVKAKERAAKALELRAAGYSFAEIAVELGYAGKQGAHAAVMAALREVIREPAEALITLDLERMDALWRAQYSAALGGDIAALGACLKILERRARLLGLDAAAQKEQEQSEPARVMIVPYFSDPNAWEQAAIEQQARLKEDVRK
jgi:hypothetical protein